jgi:hypothetical protein
MGTLGDFLGRFGNVGDDEAPGANLLSAGAPTALGAFMGQFSTLTESYWFYNHTEELKYDVEQHLYFRVDPELGSVTELYGITNTLKIIDKSAMLTPWAAKMMMEKLLRTVQLSATPDEFGSIMIAPMTLEEFTKLCMEAKGAHKEKLEDAGNIGKKAHSCLEVSVQYAIDHTNGIVLELRDVPTDEKAKACAEAGFVWMQVHKVRWLKTETKVYSKEYQYAGTMDGKALVTSCQDPSCCNEQFKDSLSIIDWKSSNSLHIEYIFQAAGAYHHAEFEEFGEDIQNCFILRLGKNDDEAGKFEPWRVPAKYFPEAFQGFLTCLNLLKIVKAVKERMSQQKKGVKEIKKQQKVVAKAEAKEAAKVQKAAERAQLKLDRAAERVRIKAEAKATREAAKGARSAEKPKADEILVGPDVVGETESPVELPQVPESCEKVAQVNFEEAAVVHKPFVIPEEG